MSKFFANMVFSDGIWDFSFTRQLPKMAENDAIFGVGQGEKEAKTCFPMYINVV